MKALFSPGVVFNRMHSWRGIIALSLQIQTSSLQETNITLKSFPALIVSIVQAAKQSLTAGKVLI